jgi:4-diphosphocytidyl-2-C-methyl-D-erythritol kinase
VSKGLRAVGDVRGSLEIRTPAKVNLGLRLTGRRDDGYHLLESVFAPIDLWDEIEVELSPGPNQTDLELVMNPDGDLPPELAVISAGPDNLVVRAAEAFRRSVGLEGRIQVKLRKVIPAGAGLGGGSSDAAAVLKALDELVGAAGPGPQELASLALGLGADVPFFLSPVPAFVRGIGELIEPIAELPALDLVIANPGISVATAEVYRVADALTDSLTGPRAGSTMRAISRLGGETGDWPAALGELLVNDLMPAAIRLCPPIGRLLGRMRELGSLDVSMSGSGATVFGVFESAEQAQKAAEALKAVAGTNSREEDCWVRVSRVILPD